MLRRGMPAQLSSVVAPARNQNNGREDACPEPAALRSGLLYHYAVATHDDNLLGCDGWRAGFRGRIYLRRWGRKKVYGCQKPISPARDGFNESGIVG